MTGARNLYNTAEYRRRKREFIASVPPVCSWPLCPVPGRMVDVTLSGNHPLGPTIDHVHPTSKGGDFWTGWALTHRRCNQQKGDRLTPRPITTPDRRVCRCGKPMQPTPDHTHACW